MNASVLETPPRRDKANEVIGSFLELNPSDQQVLRSL
jgi:hypothetical protein